MDDFECRSQLNKVRPEDLLWYQGRWMWWRGPGMVHGMREMRFEQRRREWEIVEYEYEGWQVRRW
jgi:hypothetical protein